MHACLYSCMCTCIYVYTYVCICDLCMYVRMQHACAYIYVCNPAQHPEKKNPSKAQKKKPHNTPESRPSPNAHNNVHACMHALTAPARIHKHTLTLTHTHHDHLHPSLTPLAPPHLGCFASVARCHTKFSHSFSARTRRLHCCPPALAPMCLARYWGSPGSCWTCWTPCPGAGMGNFGLLMWKFWLLLWNF